MFFVSLWSVPLFHLSVSPFYFQNVGYLQSLLWFCSSILQPIVSSFFFFFFFWSCEFLQCSFICCMFLCIFILLNLLSLGVFFLYAGKVIVSLFAAFSLPGWCWNSALWRFLAWQGVVPVLSVPWSMTCFVVSVDLEWLCHSVFQWTGLCSCCVEGLAWCIWHCSVLTFWSAWS